jgi:CMP-N,N'-diacetyllegionaminic acid synthase
MSQNKNQPQNQLCSICARGGSKGVPQKNLRLIQGKPLIAYSVEQALKSKLFAHISVSSDSQEILKAAGDYGADILIERPQELATDTAAKLPVIQHCFIESEKRTQKHFDFVVDLDCTSPLRSVQDIQDSLRLFQSSPSASNLITGAPARRSPYFNLVQKNSAGFIELAGKSEKPILRRQDAPVCYDMNASIYIWSRESLLKSEKVIQAQTIIFEMPEERSLDIDSELDFQFVAYLLERKNYE